MRISDESAPPSFSSNQRWKVVLNVGVSLLALGAILLMLNYLGVRHYRRWHLGAQGQLRLSPVTREVLRSLTNDVKVIVFFDRTKPLFDMVLDLLREYQQECGRLQLSYVDYERSPGLARSVQLEYGLDPAAEGDRIIFDAAGRRRVVYARDLSEYNYDALLKGEEAKRTGFKGEQLFTSALFSLQDSRPAQVCFLQGHREHDPADKDDAAGYYNFAKLLLESQMALARLSPTALLTADVPSECQLLIVANPITPLAPDELARIDKYLNGGGRMLVLFSSDSLKRPTGLERLLATWGVEVGDNVISDPPQGTANDSRLVTVDHFGNHPVVSTLGRSRLDLIMPRSIGSRLKSPQSADAPKVVELATTSPEGVATLSSGRIERKGATIPLMVAVEKGAIKGLKADRGTARLVVVGDSYFLVNNSIKAEANRDFARNAVNWLMSREALLQGVGSHAIKEYRISMTTRELTRIRWLFLVIFPGAVLFLGGFVWVRRRA